MNEERRNEVVYILSRCEECRRRRRHSFVHFSFSLASPLSLSLSRSLPVCFSVSRSVSEERKKGTHDSRSMSVYLEKEEQKSIRAASEIEFVS